MSRNEEKQMARMIPNIRLSKKENPLKMYSKDWILSSTFEKVLFVLGSICVAWKIFDIIILGRWV